MQHRVLDQIVSRHVLRPQVAQAAVTGLAVRHRGGWTVYTGAGGSVGAGRPANPQTLFDLASLSKPFLAVLCAELVRLGELAWHTELGTLLPLAQQTPMAGASIELLLSHRAGLEAHVPLYAPLEDGLPFVYESALERAARSVRADCRDTPGGLEHAPLYSDLGYLLVGAALEHSFGTPLDQLLANQLFSPLALEVGSARQWLGRGGFKQRVAATEVVRWRGGELAGVVHDENCWALSGHGAAGHAGLFASVVPLLRFGALLVDALNQPRARFTRDAIAHLVQRRPGGTLRCGFDGKSETGASAGATCGPNTFGHLGFTGTSMWCDPDAELVTVLLTNRVNPTRANQRIKSARPTVHDRLFRLGQRLQRSRFAPAAG